MSDRSRQPAEKNCLISSERNIRYIIGNFGEKYPPLSYHLTTQQSIDSLNIKSYSIPLTFPLSS
ncbi:MAG: hypothetical protein D6805_07735 [Planctomycetota bacterium]|nr:MAG: hypothetical protein D6805_07735 [Planctomycetota bacterium]